MVAFSDEKIYKFTGALKGGSTQNRRLWLPKNIKKRDVPVDSLIIQNTTRFQKNYCMVACAVSAHGLSPPVFCKKGLKFDTSSYVDLVTDCYGPHVQGMFPDSGDIYLQDGAPSHTAGESVKVLDKIFGKNKWIQNPSNSPDLNVLDFHTWNHLDQMVQKSKNIKNIRDLKREIVRAFLNINKEEVKKAVQSWKKRLRADLAVKGNRFEHTL